MKLNCAVIDQAIYSHFYTDLARALKQEYGATLHLYANSEVSIARSKNLRRDIYDTFNVVPGSDRLARTPEDEDDVLRRVQAYEERYGIPMPRFLMTDRSYGLGFAPGGFHHPRLTSAEAAPLSGVWENYLTILDFWENEFRKKNISLVLNGGFFEYFPARAQGIPVRRIYGSRFRNLHLWTDDPFGSCSELKPAYQRTKAPMVAEAPIEAPHINREYLDAVARRARVGNLAARLLRKCWSEMYRRYKGERKKYDFLSEISYLFRVRRSLRELYDQQGTTLDSVSQRPYVYYALQVEPEVNLQTYSQEYFHQLALISSVARDLPAGYFLLVKEHLPAVGRRPDRFYEQIKLLKNVEFADVRASGLALVQGARAVVTITGTAGQEAAALGIPVITFGRHNLYNVMPHVKLVRSEEDIYPALKWALSDDFDRASAREEGARFLEALKSVSFDLSEFGQRNQTGYTKRSITHAAELLLSGLSAGQRSVKRVPQNANQS